MIFISHRGNTTGAFPSYENEPLYIDNAINKGFDVEIDVWYTDKILYLGHDTPMYRNNLKWFEDRAEHLWIHCKNLEAALFLNKNIKSFNFFWHQTDDFTLTSKGFFWTYPGKTLCENSIAVLPEIDVDKFNFKKCYGVCSDYCDINTRILL